MMTQEEFMDVKAMRRQGLSFKEIGDETGYHPRPPASGWPMADHRLDERAPQSP